MEITLPKASMFAVMLLAVGCGETKGATGSASAEASPSAQQTSPGTSASAASSDTFAIPDLKLTIKGQPNMKSKKYDGKSADGGDVVFYQLNGPDFAASIADVTKRSDLAKTIEDAKKKAHKPSNFKEEKLADGWVLTYESDMGGSKEYTVESRREIGGAVYSCGSAAQVPERMVAGAQACKSLKRM